MEELKKEYPEWIEKSKAKDLTNQRFGELTVLYRYYKNSNANKANWVCKCSCGKVTVVLSNSLLTARTKSCGHIHSNMLTERNKVPIEEIINKRYGNLIVIQELDPIKRNSRSYRNFLCKCDCGGYKNAIFEQLQAGDTTSCGCIVSKGEERVAKILISENINFERQTTFNDLKNINLLRFDFSFKTKNNNIALIEFNGRQHYDETSRFYSKEQTYRDELKKEYSLINNIPLLIFTEPDSNEDILLKIKGVYNEC